MLTESKGDVVISGDRDSDRWVACDEPAAAGSGFRAEVVWISGEELLVLHGHGELDLAIRHEAHAAIAGVLQPRRDHASEPRAGPAALVIDLSRATYLGATVIAALIDEAERTPSSQRARLVIAGPGMPARVAELLDLDEIFDVYDDLDRALTSPIFGS